MARTQSLSDVWKQERAAREEMKKRETAEAGPSATTSEGAVDSDDDIIVGEIIRKSKASTARGKGKAKAKSGPTADSTATTTTTAEETKADRLR